MKTIKKSTISPFLTSSYLRFFSLIILASLLLFSITGFISEQEGSSNTATMFGVVFKLEVKDYQQTPPKIEDMEIAVLGRNIKMNILPDSRGQGKGKMIFRGDRGKNGEVVLVDDDKNEYYVMDDAFVDSMLKRVDQSKSMMNEAFKGLTKEQRDMIEKMQKEKGAKIPGFDVAAVPQMKLVNTGIKATKAGYPCVKYEVYLGDVKIREIWTTHWSNLEGGEEAEVAFNAMNGFFEKMKDKMGDLPGGGGFYDENNFDKGFPVVTKGFDEDTGDLEEESTLKSARRRTLDPSEFEPPSGSSRKTMLGDY